jgi:carboxymethylenebutenolidase
LTNLGPWQKKCHYCPGLAQHIYWDQASVLAQLGLIDAATLPVCGADTARKALDPSLPANALIRRAALM